MSCGFLRPFVRRADRIGRGGIHTCVLRIGLLEASGIFFWIFSFLCLFLPLPKLSRCYPPAVRVQIHSSVVDGQHESDAFDNLICAHTQKKT